jgi:membrane protein implicated in regulation of membrane protease activity
MGKIVPSLTLLNHFVMDLIDSVISATAYRRYFTVRTERTSEKDKRNQEVE